MLGPIPAEQSCQRIDPGAGFAARDRTWSVAEAPREGELRRCNGWRSISPRAASLAMVGNDGKTGRILHQKF